MGTSKAGYVALFLQGVAALLPWNVFITAEGYFADRLRDTSVHDSFLTWFSMAFNLTAFVVLGLNTVVLRAYLPRPSVKINLSLVGIALVVLVSTVLVKTPSIQGMVFFNMTMVSIVIAAICAVYLQEGLFELTASFPEIYTQAIMTGQSLAGFLVALSAFIITWTHLDPKVFPLLTWAITDRESSAFSYFLTAFFTIIVAIIAFAAFLRSSVAKFYMKTNPDIDAISQTLLDDDEAKKGKTTLNPAKILWLVRYDAAVVFLTFLVTLAIFPVLTSAIQSTNPNKTFQALFTPLSYVLFNGGDLLGRIFAGCAPRAFSGLTLLVLAILRLGFFPLFAMCNLRTNGGVFKNDAYPIAFIIVCSFTNGLFVSLAMMHSVHHVAPHQREIAGALMFFCLTFGLTAGSFASFGVLH
ncbi:Equilibrative Nucleoside Transporter (ENT) Family [Thraustotheca clavata]|uniref:Equilibrative Nucleoside Transporter (ENT) Family n=1 Tax=Thraustotheca clavata TaxID=74557 RepID=A0A1V9Z5F6_9STRA|nr:Equilibrative Nucleoside Transporter (ENT) Family [Thraustotheca clavata]